MPLLIVGAGLSRDSRDDGLRPDRRDAGRTVPDPHPLHLHVAALSHRQRLVRRPAAPIAVTLVAATGNIYAGLWYPIAIAAMTFIIGMIFVPETKDVDINTN